MERLRRSTSVTLVGLSLSLGVTACGGGGGDDVAVKRNLQRFLTALARGDGQSACALVTPAGQQALATQIAALTHATHQVSCQVILTQIAHLLPPAVKQGLETAKVQRVSI